MTFKIIAPFFRPSFILRDVILSLFCIFISLKCMTYSTYDLNFIDSYLQVPYSL